MGRTQISRRTWLHAAWSGVLAAGLVKTRFDAVDILAQEAPVPTPPTRVLGRESAPLGSRAPTEQLRRISTGNPLYGARTPIQALHGIITPSDLHFERHHSGIPEIDPDGYELLIHGMVERPMSFRLQDLKRYPSVSRIHFLECSGNGGGAYTTDDLRPRQTPQEKDGLLSTSEWTGVPAATLLGEVGVRPGAGWIIAEGGDAVLMNRSIPLEKALDDALIAYGQNGEAIRPGQGYPARLFLPGWEGNANVKWIRRIEVTDRPVMSREETSKYTDPMAGGVARQFSFVMAAKSVITFPAYPQALPDRGWWQVEGLAWSGRGGIARVDVSADGGRSWQPAELQPPVLPRATTRFRFLWNWDGRESMLMSRATDDTGYVQPEAKEFVKARKDGGYHSNYIRAWKVGRDGTVTYGLGDLL